MFLTFKLSRKKGAIILGAIAALLIAVVIIHGVSDRNLSRTDSLRYGSGILTNEDRVAYLRLQGWEVEQEPVETKQVVIPREFSQLYSNYNDLQKEQGFDLENYMGFEVEHYTYKVTNYPSSDNVQANVYILNGQVIGGDVHSTSIDGFMRGIK